jgi:hypothetical protein
MKNCKHWILSALLSGVALSAMAQMETPPAGDKRPADGQRRQPPAEAIAACKDKAEGTKVTFTGRRGEVTGTCTKRGDMLVAVPERGAGRPDGAGGPPPAPPAK